MLKNHEPRTVLYDHRAPRWVHAVCLLPTLALTGFMLWFVFLQQHEPDAFGRTDEIGLGGKFVFGFFVLIGVFLTGVFTYRLFANPPYFILYSDGFEYSPGGVSTGIIKWTDVEELRDETVLQSGGHGSALIPVTAVVLRNPGEYMAKFPAVLEPLFKARMKMNSSPILITKGDFGRKHEALLAIMREQVAKAQGRY